jgi:hypothetical protein
MVVAVIIGVMSASLELALYFNNKLTITFKKKTSTQYRIN